MDVRGMKKCSMLDCPAPKGLCVEQASGEYLKCEYWLMLELGTFVEVNMPESEIHGVRLFIIDYDNDIDGIPGHILGIPGQSWMKTGGFVKDVLTVIKPPKTEG